MAEKIRVVVYGLGEMGSRLVRLLASKKGFVIVGAIDARRGIGEDLGKVVGIPRPLGIKVSSDPHSVLSRGRAHVVLHATTSLLEEVYPQIIAAIEARANVISICEEMGNPWHLHPGKARKMHTLAKASGVTVLGTGLNPGFLMDSLVVHCTGICQEVRRIHVSRSADSSSYGPAVLDRRGFGLTPEQWKKGLSEGRVAGHYGNLGSMATVAESLGWKLDAMRQEQPKPILAEFPVETAHVRIAKGSVRGFVQAWYGIRGKEKLITFTYETQVYSEGEERFLADTIRIEGTPSFSVEIKGIDGPQATAAIAVNTIPDVLRAEPGLTTVRHLPNPSAIMSDVRRFIMD